MALGLLGPVGLEGQVSVTPTPFVEFDAQGPWIGFGLALSHPALAGPMHAAGVDFLLR